MWFAQWATWHSCEVDVDAWRAFPQRPFAKRQTVKKGIRVVAPGTRGVKSIYRVCRFRFETGRHEADRGQGFLTLPDSPDRPCQTWENHVHSTQPPCLRQPI